MSYELGTPVHIPATFLDADGAPYNPGAVVLTITKPDQTTATPSMVNPSTGVYTYDYATTQYGHYSWAVTSATGGSLTDVFNVAPATNTSLFSLSDAKDQLNDEDASTADDAEIRDYIRSATNWVNTRCGYSIPTTITETVTATGGGQKSLVLTKWPVLSVQSLTPTIPAMGVPTPDVTNPAIDSNNSIVSLTQGVLLFAGPYKAVYKVGREDANGYVYIPDDLIELGLLIFKWMWETQRGGGQSGGAFFSQGSDDEPVGTQPLPARVAVILANYMRPNV